MRKAYSTLVPAHACLLGLILLAVSCQSHTPARQPIMLDLAGDVRIHDPAVIRHDDVYYLFCTGSRWRGGILPMRCSSDLCHWTLLGSIFEDLPAWIGQEIQGVRGIWAPDISYFNGRYHLYYSVSRFGRNDSAIGLVTNKTLDPNSPDYEWIDRGMVVRSRQGQDDWNAIDGNIAIESPSRIWLSWGSFWSGIKMRRIDPETGKLSSEDTTLYSLASRRGVDPNEMGGARDAVEAPFIVKHGRYWYLFVSFDLCCRGADSTYNIVVGRSRDITGSYVDRDGVPMMEGGGTLVLGATTENWKGPGHCAVLQDTDKEYLVFHAYDGQTGRSALKISSIVWEHGWPRVAALP